MNMAHKHLHELLNEDQEPFNLKSYITERCGELKRPNPRTTLLQVKKRKPITTTSSSPLISKRSLCKHACFLSFQNSPDVRKSPLFLDFPSPSPSKSPQNGNLMLKVPARTAALLLEAAMRVQKKQTAKTKTQTQTQTQIKNVGFGLFGSILKKLKDRNKNKKREIGNNKSVKIIDEVKEEVKAVVEERISAYEMGLTCSCNNSRLSSADWSESNEEKSLDLESSSSCRSEDSLEDAFAAYEKRFCSSPSSPFRFSLQRSESSGHRTPEFSSPAASPSRHQNEDKEKYEVEEGLIEIEREDEEEQCSPVSVLDPLFEEVDDDDDGHEGGDEDEYEEEDENEDDYDLECSYAIVQRAKHQLLDKLRRFERLAELDPVELEKRMKEMDEEDYDDQADEEEEDCQDDESLSLHSDDCLDTLMTTVYSESNFHHQRNIPADMKKLVSDLISEEKNDNNEKVIRNISEKLNSWKEVESNTIDMMVQLDFGREYDGWKNYQEQVAQTATEMELEIWRLLIEELTEELVY